MTNWAWDFDSDGNIDSTLPNPSTVYSMPGTYSVTLTVAGPDREDVRIVPGYITVIALALQGTRVLPDRSVEFELVGQPGRTFAIQHSQDLATWTTITNLTVTNLLTTVRDTATTNSNVRFYRAVMP